MFFCFSNGTKGAASETGYCFFEIPLHTRFYSAEELETIGELEFLTDLKRDFVSPCTLNLVFGKTGFQATAEDEQLCLLARLLFLQLH